MRYYCVMVKKMNVEVDCFDLLFISSLGNTRLFLVVMMMILLYM